MRALEQARERLNAAMDAYVTAVSHECDPHSWERSCRKATRELRDAERELDRTLDAMMGPIQEDLS